MSLYSALTLTRACVCYCTNTVWILCLICVKIALSCAGHLAPSTCLMPQNQSQMQLLCFGKSPQPKFIFLGSALAKGMF